MVVSPPYEGWARRRHEFVALRWRVSAGRPRRAQRHHLSRRKWSKAGGGVAAAPDDSPAHQGGPDQRGARKGTHGVSTNGVTANCMFFDGEAFWVVPLTYFSLPKSARAYLFPQYVRIHYLCSGPISVDPICPQPRRTSSTPGRSTSSRCSLGTATTGSTSSPTRSGTRKPPGRFSFFSFLQITSHRENPWCGPRESYGTTARTPCGGDVLHVCFKMSHTTRPM